MTCINIHGLCALHYSPVSLDDISPVSLTLLCQSDGPKKSHSSVKWDLVVQFALSTLGLFQVNKVFWKSPSQWFRSWFLKPDGAAGSIKWLLCHQNARAPPLRIGIRASAGHFFSYLGFYKNSIVQSLNPIVGSVSQFWWSRGLGNRQINFPWPKLTMSCWHAGKKIPKYWQQIYI